MSALGPVELFVLVAVAVFLFSGNRLTQFASAAGRTIAVDNSTCAPPLTLFLAGSFAGLLNLLYRALNDASPWSALGAVSPTQWMALAARSGSVWLLLGLLLRTLRLPFWFSVLLIWVTGPLLSHVLFTLTNSNADRSAPLLPLLETWITRVTRYPAVVVDGLNSMALAWLVHRPARLAAPATGSSSGGYGGVPMSNFASNTTRYLAAAAYRGSAGFGAWVLDWLDNPSRAVSPEVGVDLGLIACVAQHAHSRERLFHFIFLGLGLVLLFCLGAEAFAGAFLVVLIAAIVWFKKDWDQRQTLMNDFGRGQYSPEAIATKFARDLNLTQLDALPAPDSNLTVYSGFSPFVGAGVDLGGWSFAISVDKSKPGQTAQPFELRQLYEAVANALNRLQLPGLRQRDHFFVHGQDVRGDKYLLADCYSRPVQKLSPEAVEYFLHASDSRIRHYKWLLVEDWGGEIAFSYFLRCSLRGPTLFVEIKRFLLTPLRASLREVDTLAPLGFSATLSRLFVVAPLAALFRLIAAPFAVLGYLGKGWEHLWGAPERQRRKLIDANPLYDYGASTSVRQNFASGEYMHYFQRADSDYYQKMLEKEIIDTLIEFLDVHQVDTSDLRERQSTILNNGVIVQGGNIETGSLAVGDGARSFQKTVRKAVGKAKAAAVGAAS